MFNYSHYAMLAKNNPAKAREYILKHRSPEKRIQQGTREDNIAFLKKNGVRVFPNYKDETIQRMVDEEKEKVLHTNE